MFLFQIAVTVLSVVACLATQPTQASEPDTQLNLILPAESMGSIAAFQSSEEIDHDTSLIGQLMQQLIDDTGIVIVTQKIPTLRLLDKVTNRDIDNWMSYVFAQYHIAEPSSSTIEVVPTTYDAISIPIAGFHTKLWTHAKHAASIRHEEDYQNTTVLKTRAIAYNRFDNTLHRYHMRYRDAPSLASAIKMLLSDRAEFLLASNSAIQWNKHALDIPANQLAEVQLPNAPLLFTNINLLLDKRIPRKILEKILNKISAMERSGELEAIRSSLYLSPPTKPFTTYTHDILN